MNMVPEYTGELVNGRMSGKGVYEVEGLGTYDGNFVNGKFHGAGSLTVKGGKYEGEWEDGILIEGGFVFDDGLQYAKRKWDYCSENDRRFQSEILRDVPIGGPFEAISSHYRTNVKDGPHGPITTHVQLTPELPPGCYDVVDGYFEPASKSVFSYETKETIRTVHEKDERDWIVANCRYNNSEPTE